MADTRVDEFLDLYKRFEQALKLNFFSDSGKYESVVARYENSRASGELKEEIGAIREIRNLLQHKPKINGHYIVEPSDEVMNVLREAVQQAEHPKLAIDFGVKAEQMYKTTLSSSLLRVIGVMKERGFTHVPVIENNKLYGVVSSYTVFEFATEQDLQILTETTKVSAMKAYLPVAKHKNEYYLFMSRKATFNDAYEAFDNRDSKGRRLAVIFITEEGRADEPILAMLTPT